MTWSRHWAPTRESASSRSAASARSGADGGGVPGPLAGRAAGHSRHRWSAGAGRERHSLGRGDRRRAGCSRALVTDRGRAKRAGTDGLGARPFGSGGALLQRGTVRGDGHRPVARAASHLRRVTTEGRPDVTWTLTTLERGTTHDAILAILPPRAVVVNATGMGKDRPGSPVMASAVLMPNRVAPTSSYLRSRDRSAQPARARAARPRS